MRNYMHTSAPESQLLASERTKPRFAQIRSLSHANQWRLYTFALLLSDAVMVALALTLAFWLRFVFSLPIFKIDVVPSASFYGSLRLVLIVSWVAIFTLMGLYNRRHLLGGTKEYEKVFRATTIGMMLMVIAGFLEPFFIFARGWLLLAWIFSFLAVAGARFSLRRLVYRLRQHGHFLSPALIVGANDEGHSLAQQLAGWRTSGLHVVGFVDDIVNPGSQAPGSLPVVGNLSQLDQLIAEHQVEELILASSSLTGEQTLNLFTRYGLSDQVKLRMSSGLYELITTGLEVKEIGFVPLMSVNKLRLTGLDSALKFALDYAITIPGLILILPVVLLLSIAIKLDSPGPVLHRRRVMGLHGRQFDAYKFRTMHVNGDQLLRAHPALQAELAQQHKLKNDPRVTRLGQILRQLSLDELPQLLNVLKREMSLVGPRMISPPEMKMYGQWGMNLLTVPPGITGLWQVSGRSDVSYTERVRLDMYYIRNWTIWLDLQLLLQTIPAVVKKRGAY
jgi:exopolysaccharide biosynthesis polyprenyl glycosylphosphotransferase